MTDKEKFPPIDPSKFNITESGQVVKESVCKKREKMTDENKAEEYVNKKLCSLCREEKSKTKCATCPTYLTAYICHLDGLAEGRKERNCVNCSNHGKQFEVMKLKKENAELKAHCKAVDEVNEKMKCCGNCLTYRKIKSGDVTLTEHSLLKEEKCYRCDNYNKWELAE